MSNELRSRLSAFEANLRKQGAWMDRLMFQLATDDQDAKLRERLAGSSTSGLRQRIGASSSTVNA